MTDSILNPFNPDVEGNAVDLTDLVHTSPLQENTAPIPAIRNQAATSAFLAGKPEQAVDSYNSMMQEGQTGGNQILSNLQQTNQSATKDQDLSTVYSMLSDQKVPEAQKQDIIRNFGKSAFLTDSGAALQTKLAAAPSPGESNDSENARISVAGELVKMYNARGEVQGVVNKATATQPDRTILGAVTDAAGQFLPFTSNILTSQIQKTLHPEISLLDQFRTFFTPGTTQKNINAELNNLPPEEKIAFAHKIVDAVKNHSAIFGSDNQANAYDYMQSLTQQNYSRLDEFGTNAFAALDIVGLGGAAKSIASGAGRIGAAIEGVGKGKAVPPRVEPSSGPQGPSQGTGAFNPRAQPKQAAEDVNFTDLGGAGPGPGVTDVPFTETQRTQPNRYGPSNQLPSGTPLLTQEPTSLNNRRALIANGEQPPLLANPIKQIEEKTSTELAVTRVNPATPGEIAVHVNPGQARIIHDTATAAPNDDASLAFYGVSRDQEALNAVAPQAADATVPVLTRVADVNQQARWNFRPDDDVIGITYNGGGDEFTNTERAAIRANVVNDFESASGLHMVEGMGGEAVDLNGNTLHISATYETPTGSWSKPEDAIEQAKFALRAYGIRDDEIQLLKKDGLNHSPVELKDVAGQDGDYKIRVNTKHLLNGSDLRPHEWESFDVKRNWGDRFGQTMSEGRGSVNSWLIDAASQLHPTITGAAVNADYQATKLDKILLQKIKPIGDLMGSLKAPERMALEDYWKEANFRGIDFDPVDMAARGHSQDAIQATRHWRDFWDHHYFLENQDLGRQLTRGGYQVFDNGPDKFYAKPIAKNSTITNFYDPASSSVRGWNAGELDDLYNNGGTIAEFRRPVNIAGAPTWNGYNQTTTHMIVRNTPTEYLRGIRDTDSILNYKKGYFQITYKSPKFIDKVQLSPEGRVLDRKTVGVAGDTPTAELFRRRLAAGSTDSYVVRGDTRALNTGLDEHWDLESSAGRISQRYRGQLLEDASAPNRLGNNSFVDNPINSAIRAANSVSNRAINGPVLEAMKERFVQQYGHLIKANENHVVKFPNALGEIGSVGEFTTKELADARTSYNKITSLQHGYVNTLDQASKAFFNYVGDTLGSHGFGGAEVAARSLGERSPQQFAKKAASDLYIALNPLRQIVIQPWQAVRLIGYNPTGVLNATNLAYDFYKYKINPNFGGGSSSFIKFAEESGLLDSVDRHTLVNGSLVDLANTNSRFARLGKLLYTPVEISRKVGFDAGEYANRVMHLASVYDRWERLGRNMADRHVRALASSEASALMGDMTRAGEMPVTSSTVGAAYQFMAAPHKMLLQPTNRRLPGDVRARMFMTDAMLFGVAGATSIAGWFGIDNLTQGNKAVSDALSYGLVGMVMNGFIQKMEPGTAGVDTSGLDPRGVDGLVSMVQNYMKGGLGTAVSKSAAGQLLTGNRLKDALLNTSRFFSSIAEPDDNDPVTFMSMLSSWGELSSGWSNAMKAKMMLQTQKRFDQYGKLVDENTGTLDAIAQMFGFGSKTQAEVFAISQELSSDKKGFEKEVQTHLNDIARYYQRELGAGNNDPRFISGVTGWALQVYANDPKAQEIVAKNLRFMFQSSGDALTKQIMDACDMPNPGNIHDIITKAPNITEENKQSLHNLCNMFHAAINNENGKQ